MVSQPIKTRPGPPVFAFVRRGSPRVPTGIRGTVLYDFNDLAVAVSPGTGEVL